MNPTMLMALSALPTGPLRFGSLRFAALRFAAPSSSAARMINSAHRSMAILPGITRAKNQMATPSMMTPKPCLTFSIQAPTRGSNDPAEAPMMSNGTPKPRPMANSAAPPSSASPVWLIYSSAPARGGATQGPTMTADTAPISAQEYRPLFPGAADSDASRVCRADGRRSS